MKITQLIVGAVLGLVIVAVLLLIGVSISEFLLGRYGSSGVWGCCALPLIGVVWLGYANHRKGGKGE